MVDEVLHPREDLGEPRESGMNILLFLVTATVYWFIWLYKAVQEIARQRNVHHPTKQVFFLLAPLWTVGAGLFVTHLVVDQKAKAVAGFLYVTPWWIGGVAVLVAFFILQAFYVRGANELVRQANLTFGDDRSPPDWLAFPWSLALACFWLPYVRWLALFAGLLLWFLWSYNFQEALNRYWLGHVSLPQETPPGLKAPI